VAWDFEDGTVEGWGTAWGALTVSNSTNQAYTGTHSLAVNVPSSSAWDAVDNQIGSFPGLGPGVTVTYELYAPISAVTAGVTAQVWVYDRSWSPFYANDYRLAVGWNTVTFTLPSGVVGLDGVGVQINNPNAWSGSLYLDAVGWGSVPPPVPIPSPSPSPSPSPTPTPSTIVTVPDSPTGVVATAGYRSATVSWTAPTNDGGSPITGYVVLASNGTSLNVAPTQTSATMSHLRNGGSYTFTVSALNAVGASAPSGASNTVVPRKQALTSSSALTFPKIGVTSGADGKVLAAAVLAADNGVRTIEWNPLASVGAGLVCLIALTWLVVSRRSSTRRRRSRR
jgi:fibronectin type III domain protein